MRKWVSKAQKQMLGVQVIEVSAGAGGPLAERKVMVIDFYGLVWAVCWQELVLVSHYNTLNTMLQSLCGE
jgi:hypothetical protein